MRLFRTILPVSDIGKAAQSLSLCGEIETPAE